MSVLEVEGLRSGYGNLTIVQDVDLAADASLVTGIIGPNGSGKSTFLKSIVGLTDVFDGEIRLQGEDITDDDPSDLIKKGLTYMPQRDRIFLDLSVRENLRVGGYILDGDQFEERLYDVFDIYPVLEEKQGAKARSLSGGQQTMLSFGSAIVNDPDLILLDEPSAGLAPDLTKQIFEEIRALRGEGIALVIVEQEVQMLLQNADYVYAIEEGTVAFHDTPSNLRDRNELMEMYLAI